MVVAGQADTAIQPVSQLSIADEVLAMAAGAGKEGRLDLAGRAEVQVAEDSSPSFYRIRRLCRRL